MAAESTRGRRRRTELAIPKSEIHGDGMNRARTPQKRTPPRDQKLRQIYRRRHSQILNFAKTNAGDGPLTELFSLRVVGGATTLLAPLLGLPRPTRGPGIGVTAAGSSRVRGDSDSEERRARTSRTDMESPIHHAIAQISTP
ncbi:hypothetical protein L484_023125 [Morus notabilis]|uniref:Uncharacterized protein n=1 Tax=Morus notabilis TaxID=981085 RepID=W9SMU9_9ROSA|nr:hypothetical protein L484_023125 [Morus notabilis]